MFSKRRFLKAFLYATIGLTLCSIITFYYPPATSLFRLDLTNANLRERDFARKRNLTWANLNGAILENTDLRGADLENAVGLTLDQLTVARTDEHTILPAYIRSQREAAAEQRVEAIRNNQGWSEERSTKEERVIDLEADIVFGFREATIPPEAVPILKKLASEIQRSGNSLVQLNGHTDSKGSEQYNQPLSERRAEAVKQWLTTHGGIDPQRLQTRGYGSKAPIASNVKDDGSDDPEGRAKNRRVEIRIPQSASVVTSVRQ